MSESYLVNFTPQETRVALMHGGQVQELHIEREHSRGIVGNIYLGKVVRVLPGMQSAFVEIGLERTAFLHVADIWYDRHAGDVQKPIEKILHEGQTILIQALKDPIGTKGARLSTQLSIAGRLLVYLPQDRHIGISQRIEDEAERERLRERLVGLLPEGCGGFIVRTQASIASDEELAADIAYLLKLWEEIKAGRLKAEAPYILYRDLNLAERVLRDLVDAETEKVIIDSRENYLKLATFVTDYMPRVEHLLEHYSGDRPLFDLYGVEDEIQKALARRVDLKSGGYLIIDQTEALTTIDVNTGGFVGARTFDDTIFKTNIEAAQAIARQLRLRNLGGIILLDFIDMESEEHRLSVLAELSKALARDHTKVSVSGFTSLGLVEMTRKRTRESLAHVLCEACPTCGGRGEVKTARTVAYEIMRELVREARQFEAREFRVLSAPSVVDLLLDEEAKTVANLQDFIGKPISFHPEVSYMQEQFDIVLL
ncbi:ribonuclease G [Uliginosibacterium gangwonense]|uniref:ribonuclease G n=1 Tax=Uliginosibacterium gangwonense TaxID=392736 RepID=UPI000366DA49|nr:ribonuclease G [Uliginosibacterium gangwonense]